MLRPSHPACGALIVTLTLLQNHAVAAGFGKVSGVSLKEFGIVPKDVGDLLVAGVRFRLKDPEELGRRLEEVQRCCGDRVCGPAMAVFDYGSGTARGLDVTACLPVSEAVEADGVESRILEGGEALTLLHRGSLDEIRESYRKLFGYARDHGITTTALQREVYMESNPDNPEEDVTEIQAFVHDWPGRLARNVGRVLGEEAVGEVMKSTDRITLESSLEERVTWINKALERLGRLADEDQMYDIVSGCAHVFSGDRIGELKEIWERGHDIDEVLGFMHEDPDRWYGNHVRRGNTIHEVKDPINPEAHGKAASGEEKRTHYCHCPLVRRNIDMVDPRFCYCGAGWYRQYFEGMLGEPVRIEILKSLTRGDETCEFAIHLPVDAQEREQA
jgi:effector-binding domain-containing protein